LLYCLDAREFALTPVLKPGKFGLPPLARKIWSTHVGPVNLALPAEMYPPHSQNSPLVTHHHFDLPICHYNVRGVKYKMLALFLDQQDN